MFNQFASLPGTGLYYDPLTGQYYQNQFYTNQQFYSNPHKQDLPNNYFYFPNANMRQASNIVQPLNGENKVIITEVSDDESDKQASKKDYVDAISLNGDN